MDFYSAFNVAWIECAVSWDALEDQLTLCAIGYIRTHLSSRDFDASLQIAHSSLRVLRQQLILTPAMPKKGNVGYIRSPGDVTNGDYFIAFFEAERRQGLAHGALRALEAQRIAHLPHASAASRPYRCAG